MPVDEAAVRAATDGLANSFSREGDDFVVETAPERVAEVAAALKSIGAAYLSHVTAIDWSDRFELVYRVCSVEPLQDVVIRTSLPRDGAALPSVTGSFKGALWQEREVFDLFGISFAGHPDLRRIVLPDDWVGHPLRKDYEDERIEKRPKAY